MIENRRIQIIGGPGSGTTTLGRALAIHLAVPHHDTDDFYWYPTTPPFSKSRPVEDRVRLMHEMFVDRHDWILSGSSDAWGDDLTPLPDFLVYIETPTDLRVERATQRERMRYGAEAIAEGGWNHADSTWFIEWVSHYEIGDREGRTRQRHEAWMAKLTCPIIRVDGTKQVSDMVNQVVEKVMGDGK